MEQVDYGDLSERARRGDSVAQYELAFRLLAECVGAPNFVNALAWLERAAEGGFEPAAERLEVVRQLVVDLAWAVEGEEFADTRNRRVH